ncbi:exopolygalacturonase [Sesamum indicum]|uniref:Exopolygalacturonase n=1 Tax=Sesamum indicum TaxID=4182 RepID=A0A6I9TYM8_SESIN|nr:exopolygalacturonase [Sesamum indicum]
MAIPAGTRLIVQLLGICIACFLSINGVESNPSSEAVFDIFNYGAKTEPKFDNAQAIIKAWKAACESSGPAKVVIPAGDFMAGEVVFSGPCKAHTTTVEIQGHLLANIDPSTYTSGAWIMVQRVDNVVLTGGGIINGEGKYDWKYADGVSPLPVSLIFQEVGNSKAHNLKFVDSMGFHIEVMDSHEIDLFNLTITAPGDSPYTDGVHLTNNINVNVTDSVIATGDDCVSIGHGNQNIVVARITCGPGHGICVGNLGKQADEKDLKGVTISNCTLTGTTNGARIKTYHDSAQITASDIVFQDIQMNNVQNPIMIDQHYNSTTTTAQSKVKISNARFVNIKGSSASAVAVSLNCSSAVPCEGIELADIDLKPAGSTGPLTSACSNAKTVLKGTQSPPGPANCL